MTEERIIEVPAGTMFLSTTEGASSYRLIPKKKQLHRSKAAWFAYGVLTGASIAATILLSTM